MLMLHQGKSLFHVLRTLLNFSGNVNGNTLENLELASSIFLTFEMVLYVLKKIKCNHIEIVQIQFVFRYFEKVCYTSLK